MINTSNLYENALQIYFTVYRNKDALIADVLCESGRYALGFSYYLNISGLRVAGSSGGGFEVCL
jgi:hypothetical protein